MAIIVRLIMVVPAYLSSNEEGSVSANLYEVLIPTCHVNAARFYYNTCYIYSLAFIDASRHSCVIKYVSLAATGRLNISKDVDVRRYSGSIARGSMTASPTPHFPRRHH